MDFANYWQSTDLITKSLFFILIALSVVSWITGILRLLRSKKMSDTVKADITNAVQNKLNNQADYTPEQAKQVAEQTLLQKIGRYKFDGEKGLPILGTTAAIAPFIGLFGTVWGIFHALHSIGKSGQAGLAQVAGPVGEALIMTGLGLAVAIPAVIFLNIASRINRTTIHKANDVAHQLLADVVVQASQSQGARSQGVGSQGAGSTQQMNK